MRPVDPDRHRLDSVTHEAIFRQEIIHKELFDRALPWQQPTAYLLGGQPGAGKSHTKAALVGFTLHQRGGAIDFGSDTLRTHHPGYRGLQRDDDQTADFYTDTDARLWVDKTVDYAIERRANVVFDSTLSRPVVAESITRRFREAGYRVEVAFVAVPDTLSLLGNLQRYQEQAEKGFGRICERSSHDAAYVGVLRTADRIDASCLVDAVQVYRRGGELIYTNHLDINRQWTRPAGTRVAIEAERTRVRDVSESRELLVDVYKLERQLDDTHKTDLKEIITLAQPLLASEVRQTGVSRLGADVQPQQSVLETNLMPAERLMAAVERLRDVVQQNREQQPSHTTEPDHDHSHDRGYER